MKREFKSSDYKFSSDKYSVHYSKSVYLEHWEKIMKMIPKKLRIMELGCGPGQFANMLYDNGYEDYTGVDFSKNAIEMCKSKKLKGYKFIQSNFNNTDKIDDYGKYDIVIILETLEHIYRDLELLNKIDDGKRIIISVPSFDSISHVRHFHDVYYVNMRYSQLIKFKSLIKIGNLFVGNGIKYSQKLIRGYNLFLEPNVVLGNSSLDIVKGNRIPQRGNIVIGDNVTIGANSVIATGNDEHDTIIEDNVTIAPLCLVGHGCRIGRNSMLHGGATLAGHVIVGNNVRIGMNASIRNRVKIGNNCIIGIGAVVTRDVPKNTVVVGNPARKLRDN